MRIPRHLSGQAVSKVLVNRLEYRVVHKRGSHIVLETNEPAHQRVVIPDHKVLRVGTLNSIIRAVANHKRVSKDEILALF